MNYDNSLLRENQPVTYHAWRVNSGEGTFTQQTTTRATVSTAVADFTVPRLMANHADNATLNIVRTDNGARVVSIPLIQALLLVKGYYNRPMSDQEFLDRQDNYSLTFFLDPRDNWVSDYIYVLSWRVFWQEVTI